MTDIPEETAQPEQIACGLGIEDGAVVFHVGEYVLRLTAEQADQISADLRKYAIELRNGGRLQ